MDNLTLLKRFLKWVTLGSIRRMTLILKYKLFIRKNITYLFKIARIGKKKKILDLWIRYKKRVGKIPINTRSHKKPSKNKLEPGAYNDRRILTSPPPPPLIFAFSFSHALSVFLLLPALDGLSFARVVWWFFFFFFSRIEDSNARAAPDKIHSFYWAAAAAPFRFLSRNSSRSFTS